MHDTASPASRQGDDQQTHSEYTEFQVVNFVGEPVGPRHDTEDDAYLWASSEYGRLPAEFSVEPVPECDADAEKTTATDGKQTQAAAVGVIATGVVALATTGSLALTTAVLGGGLAALAGTGLWIAATTATEQSEDEA